MPTVNEQQKSNSEVFGNQPHFDLLEASMSGLKQVLSKRLSNIFTANSVFWSLTADWRSTLLLIKQRKVSTLPFLRLGIASLSLDPSRMNVKAAARSGIFARDTGRIGENDTQGWLQEFKPMPMRVSLNCFYVDRDAKRTLRAGAQILMYAHSSAFSFQLEDERFHPFSVTVRSDSPDFTAPSADQWVDLETEGSEETQAFQFNLTMDTVCGLIKATPALSKLQISTLSTEGVLLNGP